jgi:hypothetical protein
MSEKKDTKSLEQKIDSLIEEFEKEKQERKRERVLSKIDGLYSLLLALSTFVIGIIISQHDIVIIQGSIGLLFSLVGIILSMIMSFVIGFKGMVNDSMENRILAWCSLSTTLFFYSTIPVIFLIDFLFGEGTIWTAIAITVIGFLAGSFQSTFSKRFTRWIETKLTSLLGQKVDVWTKIRKRVSTYVFSVIGVSVFISIAISELTNIL